MKLSTNYVVHANIQHVSYCTHDESFNFYSDDDNSIEIYGAKPEDVIRLVRNYFLCHLTKETSKETLGSCELQSLKEINEALTTYLQ